MLRVREKLGAGEMIGRQSNDVTLKGRFAIQKYRSDAAALKEREERMTPVNAGEMRSLMY